MEGYAKKEISLRYWLLGRGYHKASEAMEFGKRHHKGVRKDGAPEFSHQVAIALFARTLIDSLMYPEETITTIFLHDIREDYDISDGEIRTLFGDTVANAVAAMTKVYRSHKRDPFEVFDNLSQDPVASIAKGMDRIHNFSTMLGAFNVAKQEEYIAEAELHFIPMLKRARRMFPQQEAAYENVKWALRSQIDLIKAIHAAKNS